MAKRSQSYQPPECEDEKTCDQDHPMNSFRESWLSWLISGLMQFDGVITGIATIFLAVITGFLGLIAYWQYQELHNTDSSIRDQVAIMRNQLAEMKSASEDTRRLIEATNKFAEAAKRQAEISESATRAWFGYVIDFIDTKDKDHPFKMKIGFKNYGREIASKARFWVDSTYIRAAETPWYEWSKLVTWKTDFFKPNELCNNISEDDAINVYPALENAVTFEVEPTPHNNISEEAKPFLNDEVREKKTAIVVYGCVIYETTGRTHHKPVCAFLEPKSGKEISEWEFNSCLTGSADYEVKN